MFCRCAFAFSATSPSASAFPATGSSSAFIAGRSRTSSEKVSSACHWPRRTRPRWASPPRPLQFPASSVSASGIDAAGALTSALPNCLRPRSPQVFVQTAEHSVAKTRGVVTKCNQGEQILLVCTHPLWHCYGHAVAKATCRLVSPTDPQFLSLAGPTGPSFGRGMGLGQTASSDQSAQPANRRSLTASVNG